MPYSLTWEPRGVYRRYVGDVTIAERLASFEAICGDPRFDDLRHCITDYLDVRHYEVDDHATLEIAALHVGPALTNPALRIVAVAVRPDVLAAIRAFMEAGFTHLPYRVFPTLAMARHWLGTPADTEHDGLR